MRVGEFGTAPPRLSRLKEEYSGVGAIWRAGQPMSCRRPSVVFGLQFLGHRKRNNGWGVKGLVPGAGQGGRATARATAWWGAGRGEGGPGVRWVDQISRVSGAVDAKYSVYSVTEQGQIRVSGLW